MLQKNVSSSVADRNFAPMKRVDLGHLRLEPGRRFTSMIPTLVFACFVAVWVTVWVIFLIRASPAGWFPWAGVALVIMAFAAVTAGLARQLPAQNVVLVNAVLLGGGAGLNALDSATGIPFGIRVPAENWGQHLAWVLPLGWATALLSSRGVARLILRPLRPSPRYGYWVLGATLVLTLLFELMLELLATNVTGAWSWKPARVPLDWHGTPWVNFFGWTVSAALLLAFVTPALINKSPVPRPPDYYPFWVWLLINLLFSTGALTHHLWDAAAMGAVEIVAVGGLVLWSSLSTKKSPGASR